MVFILFIQQVTKSMEVLMEKAHAHADLYPEALFSLVLKKCWPRGQKSFKSFIFRLDKGWNHYDFMYQQGLGHWAMTSEPGNRQAAETPLNSQNVFQFKF